MPPMTDLMARFFLMLAAGALLGVAVLGVLNAVGVLAAIGDTGDGLLGVTLGVVVLVATIKEVTDV